MANTFVDAFGRMDTTFYDSEDVIVPALSLYNAATKAKVDHSAHVCKLLVACSCTCTIHICIHRRTR